MATPADRPATTSSRKPYSSPLREQRAADTRERIVAAGAEIAHELTSWDWDALTFRAVAARAELGERTVYRHFPTERHLHDAVMQRLNQLAGVDYTRVDLDGFGRVTARVFRSLGEFAAAPTTQDPEEQVFHDIDAQRRAAVLHAVQEAAPDWTPRQQQEVAAALDLLWHVPSFERLTGAWGMSPTRATATLRWMIDLVTDAVHDDAPPTL